MSLEELQAKCAMLHRNSDITLNNMQKLADESNRVADVAHNAEQTLNDLDREFESKTGLQGADVVFLFTAVALQLTRIVVLNELTKPQAAGQGNRNEEALHKFQDKLLKKFSSDGSSVDMSYYASLEHIITKHGVPYDATAPLTSKSIESLLGKNRSWNIDLSDFIPNEKFNLFKGANHRFATLGHDPVLGLVFGTGNIITNTITCVKTPLAAPTGVGIPILTTNHVIYTSNYTDPRIATYASTAIMLKKTAERTMDQPSALVASALKQLIHIGTDLYTPAGIQIPGANLILSNTEVDKLTKYISTGDIIKVGASASLAELINTLIGILHTLMYDPTSSTSKDLYSVRTRKIILYSNVIATSSNVIWVGGNMIAGDKTAIRQLDIGGLMVTIKHLMTDTAYIQKIKEEFVFGSFDKLIQGDDLMLEEPVWDY